MNSAMMIIAVSELTVVASTQPNLQRIVGVTTMKSRSVVAGRDKKEGGLSSATSTSNSCMRMPRLLLPFALAVQ